MIDSYAKAVFQGSPIISRTYEDGKGLRAHVVIDTLAGGRAIGGVRIRPNVTIEEIKVLARLMTLKHRFVGIPKGGAKAGIEGSENLPREEKVRRLAWFAEAASDLFDSGMLGVGTDMGTDAALIEEMLSDRQISTRSWTLPSNFRGSGFYTALTVVESAAAALETRGETLCQKRVAIEGFGSVGANVARLLAGRGVNVVAVSTREGMIYRPSGLNIGDLLRNASPLEGHPHARVMPKEELLSLNVDVLFPCGPGGTIGQGEASEIAASIVAPGANFGVSLDAACILHQRGRLAIPCFISNCGGTTASTLRMGGVPEWAIERLCTGIFRRRVTALLEQAVAESRPPIELALLTLPSLPGGSPTLGRRGLLASARAVVRSRFAPRALFAIPTYAYFAKRIGNPMTGDGQSF